MSDNREKVAAEDVFLNELRAQTHESHKALEENDLSKALLSKDVTVADYQTYLVRMYGLKKGLELDVYPLLQNIFPNINNRKKSHLVKNDLLSTGLSEDQINSIDIEHFAPQNENTAMGIMYVLEGSTLGGRILYKHINKSLGFDEKTGASFFHGYGENTGMMWKQFLQILTGHATTGHASQEIINSAKNTFTKIGTRLST